MLRRLTLAAVLIAAVATAAFAAVKQPDKLVVCSIADVSGRINPCGCDVPQGGLARHASFADSVRMDYDQVLVVDAGGYFPDSATVETGVFMVETMKAMGYDAVGTGHRDLRFGLDVLRDNVRRTGLPAISTNLYVRALDKPALTPWIVKEIGTVKVGILSVISDRVDLGPSRSTLVAKDPFETAKNAIAAMKAKGATVIVLLSQLGKIDTEELVVSVPGIDVAVVGHHPTVNPVGRMLGKTILSYGGEQGHYMAGTIVTLDASRHMATAESNTYKLTKDYKDNDAIAAKVKAFNLAQKAAGTASSENAH